MTSCQQTLSLKDLCHVKNKCAFFSEIFDPSGARASLGPVIFLQMCCRCDIVTHFDAPFNSTTFMHYICQAQSLKIQHFLVLMCRTPKSTIWESLWNLFKPFQIIWLHFYQLSHPRPRFLQQHQPHFHQHEQHFWMSLSWSYALKSSIFFILYLHLPKSIEKCNTLLSKCWSQCLLSFFLFFSTLDADPIARMESFRALKLSRLESFRVLKR